METDKVLEMLEESFGQRVAQKVGGLGEIASHKVEEAADTVSKATMEATHSMESLMTEGLDGLRQKAIDYARRQPFRALVLAAGAGILMVWLTNRRQKNA